MGGPVGGGPWHHRRTSFCSRSKRRALECPPSRARPRSLLEPCCLPALEQPCTTRRDKTDLLSRGCGAPDRRRMAHVLVISTSVRVLDRVHRRTTDLRPRVALHAVPGQMKKNRHQKTLLPRIPKGGAVNGVRETLKIIVCINDVLVTFLQCIKFVCVLLSAFASQDMIDFPYV